jgi:deoxycytidylate deaminase
VACLLKAISFRKQVDVMKVERYGKDGRMRMAFPCESCQAAIKSAGVKRVMFTTEDGWKQWLV